MVVETWLVGGVHGDNPDLLIFRRRTRTSVDMDLLSKALVMAGRVESTNNSHQVDTNTACQHGTWLKVNKLRVLEAQREYEKM